jgi:hypothetical protein
MSYQNRMEFGLCRTSSKLWLIWARVHSFNGSSDDIKRYKTILKRYGNDLKRYWHGTKRYWTIWHAKDTNYMLHKPSIDGHQTSSVGRGGSLNKPHCPGAPASKQKRFVPPKNNWPYLNGINLLQRDSKLGLSVLIVRGGRHGGNENTREGPEHGNQWKTVHVFEMFTNTKIIKHVLKTHISERKWVHPEREDDARRHHNGLEPTGS